MIHVNGFIRQQVMKLLENNRYAMLVTVFLSLLPYSTWLSLALIAIVTLRKGWRDGALLMMPVMTAFLASSLYSMPTIPAVINTLLTFIPCYVASCLLGITASWRVVAGFFFLLVALSSILLQAFLPEFIMTQYQFVSAAIKEIHPDTLSSFINDTSGLKQLVLANYLFGLQLLGVVFAALLPIAIARSVQSSLFYPEGFKLEMRTLRGNKLALSMLVIMLIAANQNKVIAMNILPLLVFYFLLAGLSLCSHVLAKKKMRSAPFLLGLPIFFLPFVMIPVYVILGSLDSLINLRLYLPTSAGKTT